MHARCADEGILERNFAAPERIDAQGGLHFVGGEERLGVGGLSAVDDQALEGGAEVAPADGEAPQFDARPGHRFQTMNESAAEERVTGAAAEEDGHRKNGQGD